MGVLEELKYYCLEENPEGALMLSGEWGSGKTYMIENEFKSELKDSCIIIRISLYNFDSLEKLKDSIHKEWMYAYIEEKNVLNKMRNIFTEITHRMGGFLELFKKEIKQTNINEIKEIIKVASKFGELIQNIKITNKIGLKKVIIVFDDLERAGIQVDNLLGCINDYCENRKFNVILVANEEQIENQDKYKKIKEKIVKRTIYYKPNFEKIFSNIIQKNIYKNKNYKIFLDEHYKKIAKIFSLILEKNQIINNEDKNNKNNESRKKIQNIRSIQYAIQDFERIYIKLYSKKKEIIEQWLYTYIVYVIAFRSDLLLIEDKGRNVKRDNEENMGKWYPALYSSDCITESIIEWIVFGEWNEESLEQEIKQIFSSYEIENPIDIVKKRYLLSLEEDIIRKGLPKVIIEAYRGNLSLNEYVLFIENIKSARENNLLLMEIQWGKVEEGIEKQIDKLLKEEMNRVSFTNFILNPKEYEADEMKMYNRIMEFSDGKKLVYAQNENMYIKMILEKSQMAFLEVSNKMYRAFSETMEIATEKSFVNSNNDSKMSFPNFFFGMWENYNIIEDIDKEETMKNFKKLKKNLETYCLLCDDKKMYIAKYHTKKFIDYLDKLIEKREIV